MEGTGDASLANNISSIAEWSALMITSEGMAETYLCQLQLRQMNFGPAQASRHTRISQLITMTHKMFKLQKGITDVQYRLKGKRKIHWETCS
jgi:hypothetical protein